MQKSQVTALGKPNKRGIETKKGLKRKKMLVDLKSPSVLIEISDVSISGINEQIDILGLLPFAKSSLLNQSLFG